MNSLPEDTISIALARYTIGTGWEMLQEEKDVVAELGKLSAPIDKFSIFAILAQIISPPSEPPASPPPTIPPAHFVVSGLNITPGESKVDETITITALVTNDGGQAGTYTIELKINGQIVDTEEVTLGAVESQEVSFTLSEASPGQYIVDVSGLGGGFTVTGINWWLIIGAIAGVIIVGWGLIWLVKRRRSASAGE